MLLETTHYSATAPGAAGAAAAFISGDTGTVRNSPEDKLSLVVNVHAFNQGAGFHQLVWPSGHDTTRNFRQQVVAGVPSSIWPLGFPTRLRPQELVTATIAGSATAGDIELGGLTTFYEQVPGMDANLGSYEELVDQIEKVLTVQNSITPTAGATYYAAQALNAGSDLLKANRYYALLGYQVSAACCSLTIRGADTANARVGMPGTISPNVSARNYFADLSYEYGLPMIPVINSANKSNTFIEVVQNEVLTSVTFGLTFALLRPDYQPPQR